MKIHFDYLTVEITRRCNLACAHCFRGEAQDVDISHNTIDVLLDRTARIDWLTFTGGEPSLNLDAMQYFLEGLKQRKIPLKVLSFATNGIIKSNDFITLLREYNDYTHQYNSNPYTIVFGISDDRFHKTDCKAHLAFWRDTIGDFAYIKDYKVGEVPFRKGRGQDLKELSLNMSRIPSKVGYFTPTKQGGICAYRTDYKAEENIIRLPCTLMMSYDGMIFDTCLVSFDEYVKENSIFDVYTEDIVKSIDDYNVDKPYCQIMHAIIDSETHSASTLSNVGIWGIQKSLEISHEEQMFDESVGKEDSVTVDENIIFAEQYEQSTDANIVNAIYKCLCNKPLQDLNQKDINIINKVYAELQEKYRRVHK